MLDSIVKRKWIAWALLVSLWVTFTSGISIHAHSVEHSHDSSFLHQSIVPKEDNHYHGFSPHVSIDASHQATNDGLSGEQDLSSKGLTKSSGFSSLIPLFIITLLVIVSSPVSVFSRVSRTSPKRTRHWYLYFNPQLRAPPRYLLQT